ncbi:unnamed protein product [Prorocentrum cordatum]|uniref:Uncharacterized protein n=1 Tax=Prorocentrum cordatum TaxID=2364126 RepID=A0ABN9WZI1_9DINO|nr:unnamed protein product [Polarella glacialis]
MGAAVAQPAFSPPPPDPPWLALPDAPGPEAAATAPVPIAAEDGAGAPGAGASLPAVLARRLILQRGGGCASGVAGMGPLLVAFARKAAKQQDSQRAAAEEGFQDILPWAKCHPAVDERSAFESASAASSRRRRRF